MDKTRRGIIEYALDKLYVNENIKDDLRNLKKLGYKFNFYHTHIFTLLHEYRKEVLEKIKEKEKIDTKKEEYDEEEHREYGEFIKEYNVFINNSLSFYEFFKKFSEFYNELRLISRNDELGHIKLSFSNPDSRKEIAKLILEGGAAEFILRLLRSKIITDISFDKGMSFIVKLKMVKNLDEILKILQSLGYEVAHPGFLFDIVDAKWLHKFIPQYKDVAQKYRLKAPRNLELMSNLITIFYNQSALNQKTYWLINTLIEKGYRFEFRDIYLLNEIAQTNDTKVKELLSDREKLIYMFWDKLEKLEHTLRVEEDFWAPPLTYEKFKLLDVMKLIRIYYALESMGDQKIRTDIGELIKKNDIAEYSSTEVGGYIKLDDGKLQFVDVPSEPFNVSEFKREHRGYEIPKAYFKPAFPFHNLVTFPTRFGGFHIHSDKKYAGPSWGDRETALRSNNIGFVITKLNEQKFNLDIYFEVSDDKEIIIDLGNYSYSSKIILKNYKR